MQKLLMYTLRPDVLYEVGSEEWFSVKVQIDRFGWNGAQSLGTEFCVMFNGHQLIALPTWLFFVVASSLVIAIIILIKTIRSKKPVKMLLINK